VGRVVTTEGITDADERLHRVEDPSPHWSDSLYFNAWDPATDTFVMSRMAVLANAGRATAGLLVWREGAVVHAYGQELDHLPQSDWDVMAIGGLSYRMLSSGQSWAVQLDEAAGGPAHLEWHGLDAAVSYDRHPNGPLPRAVAWGHYEQTCKVAGDLVVQGDRIRFDGFGQRDHSWGYRHWAGLHQWHWVTGFLTDGRAFNLFEVLSHDDVTTVNGYVQGKEGSDYVVTVDRHHARSSDGGAERFRLDLGLAGGGVLQVTGERAGGSVPVRPANDDQTVVVHETPVRITADGTSGYGIYEHLVTEFD
jgi:hypothetical protein